VGLVVVGAADVFLAHGDLLLRWCRGWTDDRRARPRARVRTVEARLRPAFLRIGRIGRVRLRSPRNAWRSRGEPLSACAPSPRDVTGPATELCLPKPYASSALGVRLAVSGLGRNSDHRASYQHHTPSQAPSGLSLLLPAPQPLADLFHDARHSVDSTPFGGSKRKPAVSCIDPDWRLAAPRSAIPSCVDVGREGTTARPTAAGVR